MKKILFISIFLFLVFSVFSQDLVDDTIKYKLNRSSLYGGLGLTPLYGNLTANYEIILVERPNRSFIKRGLRAGAGLYQYYSDTSLNFILSYTCITGKANNHFEMGLGISYMHFLTRPLRYIVPAPNIGYRYQKPSGKFLFRTGIGFPELVYVGFGYAFNQTNTFLK